MEKTKSAVAEAQVCAPAPSSPSVDHKKDAASPSKASTKDDGDRAPSSLPPKVTISDEVMMMSEDANDVTTITPKSSESSSGVSPSSGMGGLAGSNTDTPAVTITTAAVAPEPVKKKKKKKKSYKDMMASMLSQQQQSSDSKDEHEAIRKMTGGGAFSKIDKI